MPIDKVPYKLDLSLLGVIEGVSFINTQPTIPNPSWHYSKNPRQQTLAHYFGGIPYALPPLGEYRFKKPRPLPACYRYGTHANPGRFAGGTGICPQAGRDAEEWEEDCLQLNIWMPAGEPPNGEWPVLFHIHGGFLQWGDPNGGNLTAMLSETNLQAIVVKPAYRLNLFGFLASEELLAESTSGTPDFNVGFWDQRLALEWTYKNISYFGGDASNITVCGYSAGSHSTFHQLAHDLYSRKPVIRRVLMWSNGPGIQPHSLAERQEQFNELLSKLSIPSSLTPAEKMSLLRSAPLNDLVQANDNMKLHEFRAVTDEDFISSTLFARIISGDFARRMLRHGVQLITGECRDEHFVYQSWRSPKESTYRAAFERLQADYPLCAVKALMDFYSPDQRLPKGCSDWQDAFGRIYADTQIHNLERGFVNCLFEGGAGHLVHRYRVEWRAKCTDSSWPPEWGVTHGTDMVIWHWGDGKGEGLEEDEKSQVKNFVHDAFSQYVKGNNVSGLWATNGPKQVRLIKPSGETAIWEDSMWERGLHVWKRLEEGGCFGPVTERAKL